MPYTEERLTQKIISCIIKVHQILGPGFLESVYRSALMIELQNLGLMVESEKNVPIYYFGKPIGRHRMDLVVEKKIVLELKSVETLHSQHYAQIKSCLRASGNNIGLLVNFGTSKADFRRVEI
jgi:GxxExxY protein